MTLHLFLYYFYNFFLWVIIYNLLGLYCNEILNSMNSIHPNLFIDKLITNLIVLAYCIISVLSILKYITILAKLFLFLLLVF